MKPFFLKTTWRFLAKNKIHSLINIGGLSIGLTASLFILLWVQHETSVDQGPANLSRLYKIYEREYYSDHVDGDYDTPGLLADELKKTIPELEDAITLNEGNDLSTFAVNSKILRVDGFGAGPGIFNMFSYPLLEGSPSTALSSTTSMAISKKTAELFFGSVHAAMGKTIKLDNSKNFVVTAVFTDLPSNVSRRFDYLISWEAWMEKYPNNRQWGNSGPLTYILLRPNANPELVSKKLTHFLDKLVSQDPSFHIELDMQPFGEVYLHGLFKDGKLAGGRIEYVRLFSLVAVLILLIACINFMNLSTARSVRRAKEVGVRKAIGAARIALIRQFIGESLLITTLAVGIALIAFTLLLPLFNQLTHLSLQLPFDQAGFWLRLLAITLVTGLIAGSYPALYLSSFRPVKVLKSTVRLTSGVINLRKGLVVFQFVLSIVFITGTVVISRQISFIQTANLGYNRENLLYIPIEGELTTKFNTFKTEALKQPGIQDISRMPDNLAYFDNWTNNVDWEGRNPRTLVSFAMPAVSYDFVRTLKLQMKEGRDFSRQYAADQNAYIVNESAARVMGYNPAVGRTLTMNGRKGPIIGVIKDFHFRSLHESIKPMILRMGDWGGTLLVRMQAGKTKEALSSLERLYHQLNPQFTFTWSFSDEAYEKLYQSEQLIGKLSRIFALLAVSISCLGLLGLVMFTAEQRYKEIGIRKVLGASIFSILRLLTTDFLKLVVIAIFIAIPVAWWAMNSWLNEYAYRIDISGWMFVMTGGLAIGLAMLTISFHAVKAARENPVKSIKME